MRLHDLLTDLADAHVSGPTNIPITAIAYDSRVVQPGSLFVAITGFHADGHAYIPQALERGAVAVVVENDHRPPTTDHRPPTNDQRPTTENQEPRTKNQEPRTAGFQELGMDDEPLTQNSKLKTQNSKLP